MRVYVNYNVLNKNGKDYLNYSETLQEIIENLKARKDNIKNNWDSPSANLFNELLNNYIDDLQVDANKMKKHGNIILGIKDEFKEKDLEYKKHFTPEIVEEKTYDND